MEKVVATMKQGEQTRDRILKSANKLFYRRGFHQTAFSDIVSETGLSKGNITYHFKSKDTILAAVFEQRIAQTKATLAAWDRQYPDAASRLNCFIDSLLEGKSTLTRYGCPNATLAGELGKQDEVNRELSQRIFDTIWNWLTTQFVHLGLSAEKAKDSALELFTSAQGLCVLAHVYNDESLFTRESTRLKKLIQI